MASFPRNITFIPACQIDRTITKTGSIACVKCYWWVGPIPWRNDFFYYFFIIGHKLPRIFLIICNFFPRLRLVEGAWPSVCDTRSEADTAACRSPGRPLRRQPLSLFAVTAYFMCEVGRRTGISHSSARHGARCLALGEHTPKLGVIHCHYGWLHHWPHICTVIIIFH